MKIGVALSGCDIGGVGAYRVIEEVRGQGLEIEMLSASCLPATGALACAYGYSDKQMDMMARRFLADAAGADLDTAVGNLADAIKLRPWRRELPVAVCAYDLAGGRVVVFTDEVSVDSPGLRTIPLLDSYDVLSATLSGLRGLRPYPFGPCMLCDYSAHGGCPILPLRMMGVGRILSVSFLPERPADPYEASLSRMVSRPPDAAVSQLNLVFPAGGAEDAAERLDQAMPVLLEQVRARCRAILLGD